MASTQHSQALHQKVLQTSTGNEDGSSVAGGLGGSSVVPGRMTFFNLFMIRTKFRQLINMGMHAVNMRDLKAAARVVLFITTQI
jgi:hypothetical protein